MADDFIGQVLGGTYEIVRLLGRGGMGAVYEATNVRLGKRHAIKVLSNLAQANDDLVKRFRREAKIATDLGHPHIIDVVDFNETEEGVPYMVMEHLSGSDLEQVLRKTPILPVERAVFITRQICSALHLAHQHDVVHRDLKPGNIFLCEGEDYPDFVKVLDFGISKILGSLSVQTRDSSLLGTPYFMSPEQAEGLTKRIGPWSDIFAVGAILYRMLGGQLPFASTSIPTVLYQIVHVDPEPIEQLRPDLPSAVAAVVSRAMAKSPDDRHASVRELSQALREAAPSAAGASGQGWEDRELLSGGATDPYGLTQASAGAVQASGPLAGGRSPATRTALLVGGGGGVVIVLVGVVLLSAWLFSSRGDRAGEARVDAWPRERIDSRAVTTVARDTGVLKADATPTVTISLTGTPVGARVTDLATHKEVARLPGEVVLPRSTSPRRFRITHAGHRPRTISVTPTADRTRRIRLRGKELPPNPFEGGP